MAAWRSTTERKTPLGQDGEEPLAALSHEAKVGVKWNVQPGGS